MTKSPDPFSPEVLAALAQRQPIEALKLLLKTRAGALPGSGTTAGRSSGVAAPAADASPSLADPTAPADGLSPGEVPDSESTVWAWVVVALLAYLAYRLF